MPESSLTEEALEMKEVFEGAALVVPRIMEGLKRLHRLLQEQEGGFQHPSPALLWKDLGLLRYKNEVLDDLVPVLRQEIATQNSLRQLLERLRHGPLAALLQPGHSTDQIGHRCANGTIPQLG